MSYHPEPDEEEWTEEEGDDEDDLLVCPSCGRPVHEETQQCPHCGDWIVPAYPRRPGRRLLWSVVVVFLVAAMTLLAVC